MNMQRRSFLTYFGVGWAASCFPLVLSACNSENQKSSASSPASGSTPPAATSSDVALAASGKGFTSVGTVAQLDKAGSVGNNKVLVIRDPANRAKLIAVSPICTHKGCIVKWEAAEKTFECPCHDSHFSAAGKVQSGPAPKPLPTFSAKIDGGKVLVKMT